MAEKDFQIMYDLMCECTGSKGGKLNLFGLKQWFKQADLIGESSGLTEADVEKGYAKHAKDKEGILISELKACVAELAKEKKKDNKDFMEKLATIIIPDP
ncbi:uncharacterized protein NPIL_703051 [Nephila pilipes]|uniref:Uncharacterized protein n=1 Tax=Nephila pilipes TaxID=299642 RepID=A0A8X6N160_NEPPI|nr:uncharacterized protein NPIL_703051 [Nephila pilipes]